MSDWLSSNPLRKYRDINDVSLDELSEHLDVPVDDILDWEEGRAVPNSQTFAMFADRLDLPRVKLDWKDWAEQKPDLS